IFDRTRSNGEGFNGHLNVVDVTYQDLLSCAATDKVIARHVGQQVEEALKAGITATPTVIIKDNTTGSSVKLEGPADGVLLLSARDWLAQKKSCDALQKSNVKSLSHCH
ncbi:hypothetical protein KMT30_46075, partial [Streptomyces sp. IBSBF 2953]|nr:hypothetical protein [Streptomyces hayashii]